MKKIVIFVFFLALSGCSGVKYVGKIGERRFYSVHASYFDGPNWSAIVSEEKGKN